MKPFSLILLFVFTISCSDNEPQTLDIDHQLLQLFEKSDLDNNALFIYDFKNEVINYKVKDGWETGWSNTETLARPSSNELCRGSGLSFAKCVKKAIDAGSCLLVYKDGGEYVALKTTCPFTPN